MTVTALVLSIAGFGEARLQTAPEMPYGLTTEEVRFAEAAHLHAEAFAAVTERAILRDVRVVWIGPDLTNGSDTAQSCGLCNMARTPGGPCAERYLARVRYYTWFNIPFTELTVHCDGAKRSSLFGWRD